MKILFQHHTPFALECGSFEKQIEQTREALMRLGVEVEYLRWEDSDQRSDVLHFFGRIPGEPLRLAQQKGIKVVMTESLAEQVSWSPWYKWFWKFASRVAEKIAPSLCADVFAWESYRRVDACIAASEPEAGLMRELFGAPTNRVHVISEVSADQLKRLYEDLLKTSR